MAVHTIVDETRASGSGNVSRSAPKKKLVRRNDSDYSQRLRRWFQMAFLMLNAWIGVEFYLFVKYFEAGGHGTFVSRPAGVEGWLPIAALMNLRATVLTGTFPSVHPAGLFLLLAFLAISFLMRKAFCGWLCPIGTVSEYLWRVGRKLFRRNVRLPRVLDLALRGLKYLLLGLFLYAVLSMPLEGLIDFLHGPYGLIADVKMLNFFRLMGTAALIVVAALVIASVFIQNFWCRYLCPYGALMGLVALISPARIRREKSACVDCGKCGKACPSALPVDKLVTIRSAECMACMECVAICPAKDALKLTWVVPHRKIPAWAIAAAIAVIFAGVVSWARLTGHWNSDIPPTVYLQLIPHAQELRHP